jgi:hypothetical protein
VRLINYNENCNFSDKIKNSVPGEYNIGDCRAWRNNINLFDTERKWKFCAEDISKTLINDFNKLLNGEIQINYNSKYDVNCYSFKNITQKLISLFE